MHKIKTMSRDLDLLGDTLSILGSSGLNGSGSGGGHTLGYRVRLRMQHILRDVAELAYERPQFFAHVPPPPLLVGKGDFTFFFTVLL